MSVFVRVIFATKLYKPPFSSFTLRKASTFAVKTLKFVGILRFLQSVYLCPTSPRMRHVSTAVFDMVKRLTNLPGTPSILAKLALEPQNWIKVGFAFMSPVGRCRCGTPRNIIKDVFRIREVCLFWMNMRGSLKAWNDCVMKIGSPNFFLFAWSLYSRKVVWLPDTPSLGTFSLRRSILRCQQIEILDLLARDVLEFSVYSSNIVYSVYYNSLVFKII